MGTAADETSPVYDHPFTVTSEYLASNKWRLQRDDEYPDCFDVWTYTKRE